MKHETASVLSHRPVPSSEVERLSSLALAAGKDFNDELTFILNHAQVALETLGGEHPARAELVELQHSVRRCAEISRCLLLLTLRARDGQARATVRFTDAYPGHRDVLR